MKEIFDYIIVGAGSAGCVLASRLTEDAGIRVLLLEAGGRDWNPLIHIPMGVGKLLQHQLYQWGYKSEPEPGLNDRVIDVPRGKILGGSSSINIMNYSRGHRADYDQWERDGATGWSYEKVLPYFRRTETAEDGESLWRGGSGPVGVEYTKATDPICDALLEAGRNIGLAIQKDLSDGNANGLGRAQYTIRSGRRSSSATAYLRPARYRRNLVVRTKALTTQVLIKNGRAVGVSYEDAHGTVHRVYADREVILSAGAIDSPKLLMLSGIGPAERLAEHDIPVLVDLPVGQNLQDHYMILNSYERLSPGELHRNMRFDRIASHMVLAFLFNKGYATALPNGVIGFLQTDQQMEMPDLELLFPITPAVPTIWFPGLRRPYQDSFGIRPVVLHPKSRGEVWLRSANPKDPPRVKFNALTDPYDLTVLRKGIELARGLAAQPSMAAFTGKEITPGVAARSSAEIDAFIRQAALTVWHPSCTCPMGSGPSSVLDPEMRVRGVDGLRVVDASAMPNIVSGHTNACVLMMAEKAADLIRGAPSSEGKSVPHHPKFCLASASRVRSGWAVEKEVSE